MRERPRDFAERFRYRAAIAADRLWLEGPSALAVDRHRVAVGSTRDAFDSSERDRRRLRSGQCRSTVDQRREAHDQRAQRQRRAEALRAPHP